MLPKPKLITPSLCSNFRKSAFAKLQAKHPNVDWDAYAIAVQTPGVNRTIVDDDQASGANRTLDDGSLLTKV